MDDALACWLVDCAVVQPRMVKLTEGACIPPAGLTECYVTGLKIFPQYKKLIRALLNMKIIRSKSVEVLTLNFGRRVFAGVAMYILLGKVCLWSYANLTIALISMAENQNCLTTFSESLLYQIV